MLRRKTKLEFLWRQLIPIVGIVPRMKSLLECYRITVNKRKNQPSRESKSS